MLIVIIILVRRSGRFESGIQFTLVHGSFQVQSIRFQQMSHQDHLRSVFILLVPVGIQCHTFLEFEGTLTRILVSGTEEEGC